MPMQSAKTKQSKPDKVVQVFYQCCVETNEYGSAYGPEFSSLEAARGFALGTLASSWQKSGGFINVNECFPHRTCHAVNMYVRYSSGEAQLVRHCIWLGDKPPAATGVDDYIPWEEIYRCI